MSERSSAVTNLRAVSALAAKLADDLEGGRLWEGEFSQAMVQIEKAVRDVPSIR